MYLEDGLYRFYARVDDGLRIWVDEELIVDTWYPQSREMTVDHSIGGTAAHTIRIDYFEKEVDARAHVNVYRVGDPVHHGWKGEYYANAHLAGPPALVRNDDSLTFDWEQGSPAPVLPVDGFSVRWTRERPITPGVYRFTFHADDGVRADQAPGLGIGRILLAHMHAVAAKLGGQVGPIVQDECDIPFLDERHQRCGGSADRVVANLLEAELHARDVARVERGGEPRGERRCIKARRRHKIKAAGWIGTQALP